jgi:hypothetical protein
VTREPHHGGDRWRVPRHRPAWRMRVGKIATQASATPDGGHATLGDPRYVKGAVVILKEPLAVPDGTEVEIFIPLAKNGRRKGRGKSGVAQATCGILPSDPAVVHAVLDEEMDET